MNKKHPMIYFLLAMFLLTGLTGFGCIPSQLSVPTLMPSSTTTLTSSPTQPPTKTTTQTEIAPPPTVTYSPTPVPQPLLLRRKCGRDYIVSPDTPLQIFYGGWGVHGKDLADQWSSSLVVELTIDGQILDGDLQPPAHLLPYNCTTHTEDVYWLYYVVLIPGLAPGEHYVSVKFSTLRVLPDGTGLNFGPGQILENTFKIMTR